MSNTAINKTLDLGNGKSVSLETGKLARQADGSVLLKMGNTMLLATVVSAQKAGEGVDFLPLSVEYKEKFASAGKFPGGFLKRESRPSDYEILVCRLIDRVIRPLFPDDYHADTFVTVNLISADKNIIPDTLATLAASAALMVSDIPFNGPISEVRIGRVKGQWLLNPTYSELKESDIDMVVGASADSIVMVEGEMKNISEADMLEAIKLAHDEIKKHCNLQLELAALVEKSKIKREYSHEINEEDLRKKVWDETYRKVYEVAKSMMVDKHKRSDAFKAVKEEFVKQFTEEELSNKAEMISRYFHDVEKEAVRAFVLNEKMRIDGRKLNEIRPIWCEVNYLPATHGSALFTRGETQSLTTVTLGAKDDAQTIDSALISGSEKFILHYNFPPFSTGEAKPSRGTSRREVGHGNLAQRAIKYCIPDDDDNPYTIRVVSDILESNGSSSMATVCAGVLALMDAGIKIKNPVSGIAMGLIMGKDGKYAVLSDILGDEDHLGHMDFKVAGTSSGITACQMDIKVDGLTYEILEQALSQAKEGRLHILGKMLETIAEPNKDLKPHAPRIDVLYVPKEYIGAIIGPGGKVIQEIQRETGASISIEEVNERGIVEILTESKESRDAAMKRIKAIVTEPEVGEEYDGVVKNVQPYGAFVEILPGHQGLLHVSEIDWKRIESAENVLKPGDKIKVKLLGKDKKTGKLKLSRKVLLPKEEKHSETAML
jgi:polyribonucleotide nucleotidyltransferase